MRNKNARLACQPTPTHVHPQAILVTADSTPQTPPGFGTIGWNGASRAAFPVGGRVKRTVQSLFLPGPAGQLEALVERLQPARKKLVGLVCHPHPLYGGTLHNKVVHHTALALQQLGLPVLRFNFRGAGLKPRQP